MNTRILLAPLVLAVGCFGSAGSDDGDDDVIPDPIPEDDGCPAMFAQNLLPEYHLEIAPAEWSALQDEFLHRRDREAAGLAPEPYHPVQLGYLAGHEQVDGIPGVMVKLKGASSWLQTIDLDADPKMQFVIAFNEVDPARRFKGVRKIELDMPRVDQSFIKQRVSMAFLRQAGIPAQCANNAKLFINGTYYGLYTNLERLDKEFLQDRFGDDDDGDLWKGGRVIKTNEDTFSWARLDALWAVTDVGQLDALADLDASMREWAGEVMVGDADGYYNGRANFYLYDHPTRGFVWLPNDIDTALDADFMLADASPVFPPCVARWEPDWHHYVLAMNDPGARARYVAALRELRAKYDPGEMEQRIRQWSSQIARAASDDPHRPFAMAAHYTAVDLMGNYAGTRAEFVDAWIRCEDTGRGPDTDGDGSDLCHDCNDRDATVRPGAPETCNVRDDNCDGRIDTVDGVSVCQ